MQKYFYTRIAKLDDFRYPNRRRDNFAFYGNIFTVALSVLEYVNMCKVNTIGLILSLFMYKSR